MALNDAFIRQLKEAEKQLYENIEKGVRTVVYEASFKAIKMSPVGQPEEWTSTVYNKRVLEQGYQPGQFISSWDLGINQEPNLNSPQSSGAYDTSGDVSMDRIMLMMNNYQIGDSLIIANTARNERGEYYPRILEDESTPNKYPGYKEDVYPYSYDWQDRGIDGLITPSLQRAEQVAVTIGFKITT